MEAIKKSTQPASSKPTAQEQYDAFVKDNNLALQVYVIAPKTGAPVPIVEFLPAGWVTLFIKADYGNQSNGPGDVH